jgi:threonyl-tRNA synthetase
MSESPNHRITESPEYLTRLRHSAAHVLAQSVKHLYPGARLTIGPPTSEGFYYDIDFPQPLHEDDLPKIEEEMRRSIAADDPFVCREVTKPEALDLFAGMGETYKVEMIQETPETERMTVYQNGDFIDWCRGPHVDRTGEIGAFKLTTIAGNYWRGDAKNKMLTRVYGTAYPTQAELDAHLARLEEAKKRDHRKLGRELGLFMLAPELVGPGLPLWLPKGATMRNILETWLRREQTARGYQPVITPHIAKTELYKTSGHWHNFRENMFATMEEEGVEYVLKPVNCPHHIEIYRHQPRSYRDLPLRLAEFGTTYRHEQTGELAGLTRVRGFTVDDSHIFVRPDQLMAEFTEVVHLIMLVFGKLGLDDFSARIGLRDPASDKYIGTDEGWHLSTEAIRSAVRELELPHTEAEGEAAMYGPKLDFLVRDAIGREWQLGTVQVDYALPERFGLTYQGEDGQPHRPVMIHRAPFGSMERFCGILIEHFAGAFPLWLAPVQAVVLPIADRHAEYAHRVSARLREVGMRVDVDDRSERLNAKIRDHQLQKVPYMLVCGDRDIAADAVSVRDRERGDLGATAVEQFMADIRPLLEP